MITFDNSPAAFNPPSLNFEHDYDGAILIFDDIVWNETLQGETFSTNIVRSKTGRTYENFLEYKNGDQLVLLAYPNAGAPAAVIDFELLIASGVKHLVTFGTCGVFNPEIPQNSVIIPTVAIREEGTSYHYLPPEQIMQFSDELVLKMVKAAQERNLMTSTGPVWTTDAVYRETMPKIEFMKSRGCIGVEMELSALMAVAQYRGVDFAQFLIVDDLVPPQNTPRKSVERSSRKYIELSLDILNYLKHK